MGWESLVVAAILVSIFAVIALISNWRQSAARTRERKRFADRHDLTLDSKTFDNKSKRFPGFLIFDRGSAQHASNLIKGETRGRNILIFDFYFTTKAKSGRHLHNDGTVIMLEADEQLPPLLLRPHTPMDAYRLSEAAKDIDFPDSPGFSETFHLQSEDEKYTRALFTPEFRQFLLEKHRSIESHPSVEFSGKLLVVFVMRWASADEIEILLEYGEQIMETVTSL
ncbi:MAG: hypothetical protein ACYS8W_14900 [Planctomycetota bacterium]|jgi:hypothetical protein